MIWTPNRITSLRVVLGFMAVGLFGRNAGLNLLAVALTVNAIMLDALDGHIARAKKMATPEGAQIDILGDRMIENMYFTYFAVVGTVSLWLPLLFFARGAATDFLRGLALRRRTIPVGARTRCCKTSGPACWRLRGVAYATLKCVCFCYLGLELALVRGPVALLGPVNAEVHAPVRMGAHFLAWATAAFCIVRGLPVLVEGWKYFTQKMPNASTNSHREGKVS